MYKAMLKQSEGRIVGSYKPANRSIIIASHWASVEEMLKEAKERFDIIEWYTVNGGTRQTVE